MPSSASKTQASLPPDLQAVVQGNTRFALDFYHQLQLSGGNLFFSPYSLSTALAMTYAGARGETAAQMARTLHFPPGQMQLHPAFAAMEAKLAKVEKKGQVQFKVANSLWPQEEYPFLEEFLALAQQFYGVRITALDYRKTEAARRTINTWVEDKTEHKITELIPPGLLNALTRLVLVNAIYFKGDWASRFNPLGTQPAPFWLTPEEQAPVPLMHHKAEFSYQKLDHFQVVALPYAGRALSMLVLLPDEVDGLAKLEAELTIENLDRWTRELYPEEVDLFLPRFSLTIPFRLSSLLQSLGMWDAFSDHADFSGMDGSRNLLIEEVLHKAYVQVNEEGTQAAAATAVVARWLSAEPIPVPVVRADHPFIFLIRENTTGSLLFIGRLVDPSAASG